MKCKKCDHLNPEDQSYCMACGEELEALDGGAEPINEAIKESNESIDEPIMEPVKEGFLKSKYFKIGIALLVMVGIVTFVYQTQKSEKSPSDNLANTTLEQSGTKSSKGQVVASVSEEPISQAVFNLYFWITQQRFESAGPSIWEMESNGLSMLDIAKENTLNEIVFNITAKKKAQEAGLEIAEEEQKEIKRQAEQIMTNRPDIVAKLQFQVGDIEEFISHGLWVEKAVKILGEQYTPTEEEINEQVEMLKSSYETATVKHVLIASKEPESKTLAEDILKRALSGEDMAELAKTYSEDPGSKDTGGEYTFPRGQMVAEFEEASFTGEIGQVFPELVETTYGYHIVKVEKRDTGDISHIQEEAKERLKSLYAQQELIKLSETSKIEKTDLYDALGIIE